MDEEYGREEWRRDESAARTEAIRRIRAARDSGADTLDFSDLTALTTLPKELAEVPELKHLFAGWRRPDRRTLIHSERLLRNIDATRKLYRLQTIDLSRCRVDGISALSSCNELLSINLSISRVSNINRIHYFPKLLEAARV